MKSRTHNLKRGNDGAESKDYAAGTYSVCSRCAGMGMLQTSSDRWANMFLFFLNFYELDKREGFHYFCKYKTINFYRYV